MELFEFFNSVFSWIVLTAVSWDSHDGKLADWDSQLKVQSSLLRHLPSLELCDALMPMLSRSSLEITKVISATGSKPCLANNVYFVYFCKQFCQVWPLVGKSLVTEVQNLQAWSLATKKRENRKKNAREHQLVPIVKCQFEIIFLNLNFFVS